MPWDSPHDTGVIRFVFFCTKVGLWENVCVLKICTQRHVMQIIADRWCFPPSFTSTRLERYLSLLVTRRVRHEARVAFVAIGSGN